MKLAILIMSFFLIISCHPPKTPSNIQPVGDIAHIKVKGRNLIPAELIAVRDSNIYVMSKNLITPIKIADIENLEVPGYSADAGQKVAAALPSLFLQGVILLVASDIGESTWTAIAGASMLVTIGLYATSGSAVEFSAPILAKDIKKIRLYCRYPHDLDAEVWNEIVKVNE